MRARIAALPVGRAHWAFHVPKLTSFIFRNLRAWILGMILAILVPRKLVSSALVAAQIFQGGAMLRVEIQDSANSLILTLEGRFTDGAAKNTRTLLTRCREGMRLVVDLTEVTFVDSVGEQVLSFFGRFGAEFVAQTSYALDICERLDLRLARAGAPNANNSSTDRVNARRRKPRQTPPRNAV